MCNISDVHTEMLQQVSENGNPQQSIQLPVNAPWFCSHYYPVSSHMIIFSDVSFCREMV